MTDENADPRIKFEEAKLMVYSCASLLGITGADADAIETQAEKHRGPVQANLRTMKALAGWMARNPK